MVRLVLSASLTILFCVAARGQTSPASPATPSPTPAPALETLDAADLQRAIPLIRENYLNPAALNPTELERATLAGLFDRLGRGIILLPARPDSAPTPAPFYREIISGHVGLPASGRFEPRPARGTGCDAPQFLREKSGRDHSRPARQRRVK